MQILSIDRTASRGENPRRVGVAQRPAAAYPQGANLIFALKTLEKSLGQNKFSFRIQGPHLGRKVWNKIHPVEYKGFVPFWRLHFSKPFFLFLFFCLLPVLNLPIWDLC